MGIKQLLPFLENSSRECHLSELRGQTAAVDVYGLLHKAAISCAMDLALNKETYMYVHYCVKYAHFLLSYNIKPIMVFDGKNVPAKHRTNTKRLVQKYQARREGMQLLRLGKRNEAIGYFNKCVDITPEMAARVLKEYHKLNIDCIVAPYEADAQMAFLNINGIADFVITEDSDLLVFGCNKVLYKLSPAGSGILIEKDNIHLSMKMRTNGSNQYTFDKFRYMCILSGCDYLDSIPGVGLKKAHKFISMTAETDPKIFLDKVSRYLKVAPNMIPADYKLNFLIANAAFLHQTVYDPIMRQLVPLNPITEENVEYNIKSGDIFDSNMALRLALGNINPFTSATIDDWKPDGVNVHSIWSPNYQRRAPLVRHDAVKKRVVASPTSTITKQMEEDKFNSELGLYKGNNEVIDSHASDTNQENVPPRENNTTGPIASTSTGIKNPFLKKRKSASTEVDNIKKSRFFAPESTEEDLKQEVLQVKGTLKMSTPTSMDSNSVQSSSESSEAEERSTPDIATSTSPWLGDESPQSDFSLEESQGYGTGKISSLAEARKVNELCKSASTEVDNIKKSRFFAPENTEEDLKQEVLQVKGTLKMSTPTSMDSNSVQSSSASSEAEEHSTPDIATSTSPWLGDESPQSDFSLEESQEYETGNISSLAEARKVNEPAVEDVVVTNRPVSANGSLKISICNVQTNTDSIPLKTTGVNNNISADNTLSMPVLRKLNRNRPTLEVLATGSKMKIASHIEISADSGALSQPNIEEIITVHGSESEKSASQSFTDFETDSTISLDRTIDFGCSPASCISTISEFEKYFLLPGEVLAPVVDVVCTPEVQLYEHGEEENMPPIQEEDEVVEVTLSEKIYEISDSPVNPNPSPLSTRVENDKPSAKRAKHVDAKKVVKTNKAKQLNIKDMFMKMARK